MSAYSTREITREQAEDIYLEYMSEMHKKALKRLTDSAIEEALEEFGDMFPNLHFLYRFKIVEKG